MSKVKMSNFIDMVQNGVHIYCLLYMSSKTVGREKQFNVQTRSNIISKYEESICVFADVCVFVCVYACVHEHVFMCVSWYLRVRACVCVCVCVCFTFYFSQK